MANGVTISVTGVSKSFALTDHGKVWRMAFGSTAAGASFEALRNITFDVPKGEFVGILGRNGAGKSTLLRVTGGVYAPDAGSVAVLGQLSGLYELGLAGNPQLTGRAYAERLLTMQGFSARERRLMVADILDFSELGDRLDDPILTYSAGMSARLFFATSTAGFYDVYLIDEILSVGDQHFQGKCWRRIRERVSRGASGVLVTHDWSAIVQMCASAHIIERGRVVFSGSAALAARRYLYGEEAGEPLRTDIARWIGGPAQTVRCRTGGALVVALEAEIFAHEAVYAVAVIERLEAGYGWENALMSRDITLIGDRPGRHSVTVELPTLPLPPGPYQGSFALVMRDRDTPGRRVILDNKSWLNGTGIPIDVDGEPDAGALLPIKARLDPMVGAG
jgi:lipopolysaccharide transport system ATP-binding protein